MGTFNSYNILGCTNGNRYYIGIGRLIAEPDFVSSTDLHLTSSSNCLGVATDLGITEDRDGNLRPKPAGTNPDMGAYEYAPIILPDLTIYLEGPYNAGQMNTTINSSLPKTQPYNTSPWNYGGQESVNSIPQNVIDWVLVELRSDTQLSSRVTRKQSF